VEYRSGPPSAAGFCDHSIVLGKASAGGKQIARAGIRRSRIDIEPGFERRTGMRNASSPPHPALLEAARALRDGRRDRADALLIPLLRQNPRDPNALALLAESAVQAGAYLQSEGFARKALAAAPGHRSARWTLARALVLQKRPEDAIGAVDPLIADAPACRTGNAQGRRARFARRL
jgi:predicted Zn-dependent protease